MRIAHVHIENFRSIKLLDESIPQVCAFIGPNNAGKSNILKAIQQVLGREWLSVNSFNEEDVYGKDPEKDILIEVTIDPPFGYKKYKDADPVEIAILSYKFTRYKKGEYAGQRRLEQKCLDSAGKDVLVPTSAPKKGAQLKFEPLLGIPGEVKDSIPLIYIDTSRMLKDQLPTARYSILRQLLEDVNVDFLAESNTLDIDDPSAGKISVLRSERFNKLMQEIMTILRTDKFISLEKSIKENALRQLGFDPEKEGDNLNLFFSPFSSMDFYKSLDLLVKENGFEISATELGGGFQNALVLAILQTFEQRLKSGAILLIEEPEMFLHPQMQKSLNKTLQGIGAKNQVIYTTHSPHFVSIAEFQSVVLVKKDTVTGTGVIKSNLALDQKLKNRLLKELNSERNEMFFASRVLLVEGPTEKLAFPEWANKLGIDLDRIGSTIIEVSGKRNLPLFADIALSFGISTGIIYDEDSTDFNGNKTDEVTFNKTLSDYAKRENCKTWCLSKKYEDVVKAKVGDTKYQELCQKHSETGKPTKARLIASDATDVPDKFKEILNWLAGKES